jgi:hypothetical protein
MTQEHPITPPPELVRQWFDDTDGILDEFAQAFATKAARWGADQELEACCHCFARDLRESLALELRARRRPKPPSLKEQALQAWAAVEAGTDDQTSMAVIRRALEQLDD